MKAFQPLHAKCKPVTAFHRSDRKAKEAKASYPGPYNNEISDQI